MQTPMLASSYAGCEADPNLCMASDFYSEGGEGHASTFADPAGCNPTYQGQPCAPSVFAASPGDVSSLHMWQQGAPTASLDLVPECDPMPGWKVTWNPPDCSGGPNGALLCSALSLSFRHFSSSDLQSHPIPSNLIQSTLTLAR